jgi:DNA-binding Xre family transcriptional regulator
MITFNFTLFLFEKRKSVNDLAKHLRIPRKSIDVMLERGTVKPSFLATLETNFGDCSKYIKKPKAT